MEEQAVGGLATAAGDAKIVVRGDLGAGGGVDSWGKLVTTWERRGLTVAPLVDPFPEIRLNVSSVSIWPADLKEINYKILYLYIINDTSYLP